MTLVEEPAAIILLRLSGADPGGTLSVMAEHREILRFEADGHLRYPSFQFDVRSHHIYPVLAAVMAIRPAGWSDYRLLHWLVTPHLDLGCTPAEAIPTDGNAVLSAFGREIGAPCHG